MTSSQKTLIVGCIVGLLGAGGALLFARYQHSVQAYYGAEPQQLPVASLAGGFHGGRWVELTGLQIGPRAVVGAERGSIDAIWIPAFAAGAAERSPVNVVLRSTRSRSLEEFGLRLRDRATFRGAVLEPSAADPSLRTQLAASYPGNPLPAQIWEVDIDFGGPAYSRWATAIHSASGGLLVFGIICLLGYVGSCFGSRDTLAIQPFNSVPDLRY